MSLLYRAIWVDRGIADLSASLESLKRAAAVWALDTPEPSELVEGLTEIHVSQGRQRGVRYGTFEDEAFELTVTDQRPGDPTVWTTVIRVVGVDADAHVLVENHMESDDLTRRVSLGRPRVVHELLRVANKPVFGASALLTGPQEVPADGIAILAGFLADPARALPVIVCTAPGGGNDNAWLATANKIASRSEGVATVITLDNAAVTSFRNELGDLAVWGGGVRIYAPTPVGPGGEAWRHRYYLRSRLEHAERDTVNRIVYSVAQLSARRRVPEAFRIFTENGPPNASGEMIPISDFVAAREQWETDIDLALDERSALEKELAKANGHLGRLKEVLIRSDQADLVWGTEHEVGSSVPDEVQDTSEAVLAAQAYLSQWLVVPDSAPQELADIDTAPTAYAWGNTTWRGLRALAAYAEDRAGGWSQGGFWEWCAGGPPLGWPATPKKLSMTEGETVQTNQKISETRIFKVAPAVRSAGEMTMLAHLKIAEGGGNLAPRVYFYDDTGGPTGKVHVGFVGPHYLVPNKSTN